MEQFLLWILGKLYMLHEVNKLYLSPFHSLYLDGYMCHFRRKKKKPKKMSAVKQEPEDSIEMKPVYDHQVIQPIIASMQQVIKIGLLYWYFFVLGIWGVCDWFYRVGLLHQS